MNQFKTKFQSSSIHRLYHSFTPASRAAILFALPFTLIDAIHYYTAGTALVFSFPLLALIYMICGAVAVKIATSEGVETDRITQVGRSAGWRLWLVSTITNTLIATLLGFVSLGGTLASGVVYLCLFAPFHAVGSVLASSLGGWLYQQYVRRTQLS